MCHLVRDEHALPQPRGTEAQPGSEPRRPRWITGAAVTLVGGLALAGWADLQPGTREAARQVQPAAAVVPVVTTVRASSTPAEGMKLADDDVPVAGGKAPGVAGNCEHGL